MTLRPSTADSTEIAGVIIASPKKKAAPTTPRMRTKLSLAPQRLLGKHHKGKDAAFTLVVGAHQDQHIFDRHDEDERPDQQRDDGDNVAMHIAAGARHMGKGFTHRVERRSSDVAKDDTDAGEGEFELAAELGTRLRIAAGGHFTGLSLMLRPKAASPPFYSTVTTERHSAGRPVIVMGLAGFGGFAPGFGARHGFSLYQ